MQTEPHVLRSALVSGSESEIELFLEDAGILTPVVMCGFRRAAANAFVERGYRIATIKREMKPFGNLVKLSLYPIGDRQRMVGLQLEQVKKNVLSRIGCRLPPDSCRCPCLGATCCCLSHPIDLDSALITLSRISSGA